MYFVKITITIGDTVFTEFAGRRGVRSLHGIRPVGYEFTSGTDIVKSRVLEGWKTLKSAERYIREEMHRDEDRLTLGAQWHKEYEIVTVGKER